MPSTRQSSVKKVFHHQCPPRGPLYRFQPIINVLRVDKATYPTRKKLAKYVGKIRKTIKIGHFGHVFHLGFSGKFFWRFWDPIGVRCKWKNFVPNMAPKWQKITGFCLIFPAFFAHFCPVGHGALSTLSTLIIGWNR